MTAYDDLDLFEVDEDGCIFRPPRPAEAAVIEEFSPGPDAMVSILRIGDAAPIVNLDLPADWLTIEHFLQFAADVAATAEHLKPTRYGLNARYGLETTAVQRKTREPATTTSGDDW